MTVTLRTLRIVVALGALAAATPHAYLVDWDAAKVPLCMQHAGYEVYATGLWCEQISASRAGPNKNYVTMFA